MAIEIGLIVQLLLRCAKVDCNAKRYCGITPLHRAADSRQGHIVKMLLVERPDIKVNQQDDDGNTPLHRAAQRGDIGIAQELLKARADKYIVNKEYMTPLHVAMMAGHDKVVEALIANQTDESLAHEARVYKAAAQGNYATVESLINKDIALYDPKRPLYIALLNGHENVATLLFKRTKLNFNEPVSYLGTVEKGLTWLHRAAEEGYVHIVTSLLKNPHVNPDVKDHENRTPFHFAAARGHFAVVQALLNGGADKNIRNKQEMTPFYLAALNNHEGVAGLLVDDRAVNGAIDDELRANLHRAASENHVGVAHILIQHGAKVYIQARDGSTPLHVASRSGHVQIVQELLKKDTSGIDIPDKNGMTPLHEAVQHKHEKVVELLIKAGANVLARIKHAQTPLDLLLSSLTEGEDLTNALQNILRLLEFKQEDINKFRAEVRKKWEQTYYMINRVKSTLEKVPTNIYEAVAAADRTKAQESLESQVDRPAFHELDNALFDAIQAENIDAVKQLIVQGANINAQDPNGLTPIHCAIMQGNFPQAKLLCSYRTLNLNLATKGYQMTPLHFAIQKRSRPIIDELLKSATIDVNKENADGLTALMCAHNDRYYEILPLLLLHGAHYNESDNALIDSIRLSLGKYSLLLAAIFGRTDHVADLVHAANEELLEKAMLFAIAQQQMEVIELLMVQSDSFISKELLHKSFIKHARRMVHRYPNNTSYRTIYDLLLRNLPVQKTGRKKEPVGAQSSDHNLHVPTGTPLFLAKGVIDPSL